MKKVELLAPAGSYEKAKIAYLYGADAVYCGTSSLSLRTRADMKDDDLEKTIKYAHSIGKKIYVTLNIFAWNEKYEEALNLCERYPNSVPIQSQKITILFNKGDYESALRICEKFYYIK